MEKMQAETVHNSESSSLVTCVNRTDIDELSKEKEEELLFGADEGDDEDTLSDDSLRLRLSDDEEQEDAITNDTNIVELKSQSKIVEEPVLDTIAKETLHSDIQDSVEEASKLDNEERTQKEHTTIKAPENSALSLTEYISENKRIQNNKCNSGNTNVTANESNEKSIFKSSNDLKITEVNNACLSAVSKEHTKLENDNLSINDHIQTNNVRSVELTIHNEENLKAAVSNINKITSTNTCELNKLDNIDSNTTSTDSANVKICTSQKLSTTTTVSNNNDDNLGKKIVNKHIKTNSHFLQHVNVNNGSDHMDLVKSDNSKDASHKDNITHKSKNENSKPVDVTDDESVSKLLKFAEKLTNISLMNQNITLINKNNLINVKDNKEVTNEDRDTNKSVIQTVDNNFILKNILLIPSENHVDNENETTNVDTIVPRRKQVKKTINTVQDYIGEGKQEQTESGQPKRKAAKDAEEIIKKKYLDSDSDSNDNTEQLVIVNHKLNEDIHPASPSALKRNCTEKETFNGNIKKVKMNKSSEEKGDITQLPFIEKFFRRDLKEKLPKLRQEELEELLIQKIVETITMRSEIGQLREQARISEKYQETTRVKMQQLIKQVKDFEMVLNRNAIDRRTNPDKSVAPIKINRSVGLQVNFISEHGMQNLRQSANKSTTNTTTNTTTNSTNSLSTETNNNATSSRRGGIKIRSPRSASIIPQNHPVQTAPAVSVMPAALVVAKPLEASHTLTLSNQTTNVQPILPAPQQPIQSQSHQTIVLNGKIQNQVIRPPLIAPKPRNNDLIDLTDEEEKNKSNTKVTTATTAPLIEQQLTVTSKPTQSFQRVIQAIPTNVAITTQPASIKVITTNQQTAPTLNNVNTPRLAYVMQSATGSPRQVLIASNSNQPVQIRPVNTPNRSSFSTVTTYKTAGPIANGAVRVLATPVLSNIQISKHPAPLPDIPNYAVTPGWKLPPPAPSLKISKVTNGIVLSWNMNLTDKYADIASYQLYAYQEVAGVNPSTSLWKKVGDVRALPLPMACTLTQFSEGNNYYFAVRAVDTHSRKGQYSIPGNISL